MAYKPWFGKIDECECGTRLSTKQRVCPSCKQKNPDYRPKYQIGAKMVKEDELELKQEEDFNKLGCS